MCTGKETANIFSGRFLLKSSLVPVLKVLKTPFVKAIWLHITYLITIIISPGKCWIPQSWTFKIQLDWVLGHHDQTILLSRMVGPEHPWGPSQPGILCFYLHLTTLKVHHIFNTSVPRILATSLPLLIDLLGFHILIINTFLTADCLKCVRPELHTRLILCCCTSWSVGSAATPSISSVTVITLDEFY